MESGIRDRALKKYQQQIAENDCRATSSSGKTKSQ
jgi:hypothetical protein